MKQADFDSSRADLATSAHLPIGETGSHPTRPILMASVLIGAIGLAIGATAVFRDGLDTWVLLSIVLVLVASVQGWRQNRVKFRRRAVLRTLGGIINSEPSPSYITSRSMQVLRVNSGALARGQVVNFADIFTDFYAQPRAALERLAWRAGAQGQCHDDVISSRGHRRLMVRDVGSNLLLWTLTEPRIATPHTMPKSSVPVAMVDAGGKIKHSNTAWRHLIGDDATSLDHVLVATDKPSGALRSVQTLNGIADVNFVTVPGSQHDQEVYLFAPASVEDQHANLVIWDEVEDLPVPLLKLSVKGEVLALNREARELLPMEAHAGARLSDMLEGLGRPIVDWLAEAATGRTQQPSEFLKGTGRNKDKFVQVTLKRTGQAKDPHLLAVLSDATELKSLELQFVQSQKMQAIGQLAGGVAHDFNNLLTAISGHCDLLLLRHPSEDESFPDLIQIHQNANRAAALVGQLLAYSRKQNLVPQVIDLKDSLYDLTHLLNRLVGEKVKLELQLDPDLKAIRADKRQLEQVIMNLVVNARDAMEQGEVRIHAQNVVLKSAMTRDGATVPSGQYVVVDVIDEGTGIAEDVLPDIFQPFYTSKRQGEGTGLGLSTAYGIVKQTGGFIFVESIVGEGAKFSLYFPVSRVQKVDPPIDGPAKTPAFTQSLTDGVILLVEDEAPVRAFAARALRLRGFVVLEADCAEVALEMLTDPDLNIDVFVSDVIMPGKDGPTWVREALEQRPDTRVVFVSGYAEDSFAEHQAEIENSVFLQKPFSLTDLTRTVQEQLAVGLAHNAG